MRFGFFGINNGVCAHPDAMVRVARAAEAAGFDSVWTGEHIVLPNPQVPPSPVAPEVPMQDSVVALTWVAAHTTTIRLGTGIIILPQRNPLVLAKELASLDYLSKGRTLVGVGVGYLEPEFRALGISMERRGERTEDYIAAMRAIWEDRDHDGEFSSFAGVQANPKPAQRPGPPIVMAGHTAAAFRRAVTTSQGWYGFSLDEESTAGCLAGLAKAADRYERPGWLGSLEISVTPRGSLTAERIERFSELGVHRLIPLSPARDEDGVRAMIDDLAKYAR